MLKLIKSWFNKYFSDHEAIILLLVLLISFSLIITMGSILMPIIASIVIAYLLQSWIKLLEKIKIPRTPAYLIVYIGFLTIFVIFLLIFVPLVWKQIATLFAELPLITQKADALFTDLSKKFPEYFSEEQINGLISSALQEAQNLGKVAVSASVATIPGIMTAIFYLILIPLLVFFFLKDDKKIITWCLDFLPTKRRLLTKVWHEIDGQITNYISGKVIEIVVVGVATYLSFLFFDLRYAVLLASIVGISVIVPYVGAIIATIPVMIAAYLQWGFTHDFGYLLATYFVIQALDSNVLVPLLFSETLNLHPVAIISATIVFGAFWGFWGVFFAIPLATVVKAVINAWPVQPNHSHNHHHKEKLSKA